MSLRNVLVEKETRSRGDEQSVLLRVAQLLDVRGRIAVVNKFVIIYNNE